MPAAAALLFYLLCAPPVSGDKDGSELTLALATGGVPHPTGYPLYLLGGHAFVRLLHGLGASWAWAANAWSAVGGAVAILLMQLLATRLVPTRAGLRPGVWFCLALVPALLLGLNPLWTYEATLAEVYSWHVAWALGAAGYFAWLVRRLADAGEAWPRRRMATHALGWGLLCGAGGAHHATALLVAAPLSVVILAVGRRRGGVGVREAALVVAGTALPLLAYALVAWRAFHPAQWQWPTLTADAAGILRHVTGGAYRHFLGSFRPSPEQQAHLASYLYPYLGAGLGMLVAAVAIARGAERVVLGGLAAAAALSTVYAFNYGVPDPASYFLAPAALCLAALPSFAVGLWQRGGRWRPGAAVAGVAVALVTLGTAVHGVRVAAGRRQVFIDFDQRVRGMWESIPYERAVILWSSDMYLRLVEYQLLGGEKRGLDVWNPQLFFDDAVAGAFVARHGFHPLEGVAVPPGPPADDLARQLAELTEQSARAINQRTPLPVILFDPERESVRQLRKP